MILAYSVALNQRAVPRRGAGTIYQASIRMRSSALFLLGLTACGAIAATAAGESEKTFELVIVGGKSPTPQRVLKVEKNDAVRLIVASDLPGEIHLHGYRLQAQLTAGAPAELVFKAYATGRYPLEWHSAGNASTTGSHRGPPLATLEVRPQ